MERIITVIPQKHQLEKKIKVAAYARVSSGKDAMLHSLSAQVSYYSNLIQSHNEWLYIGVYADEATTGTKDERVEFQSMIKDAIDGKIDLIITKSISRFARNTVTLLKSVRELKKIGVDVFFEEQNIHTLSGDGELMLSILASYAQEESRSVSENMKWRIKKNFHEGKPWNVIILGYTCVNGKFEVIPDEAKVVRQIYNLFLSGKGVRSIAKKLNKEGYVTRRKGRWYKSSINLILSNYVYTGNLILQKTYSENHITKRTKLNNGELPKYHAQNTHQAIVSIEEFNKVQEELKRRANKINNKVKTGRYPFTSILICDKCGMNYQRKTTPYKHVWVCNTYLEKGKASCDTKRVPEEILYNVTKEVLGLRDFNESIFKEKISNIRICENNTLVFNMCNGTKLIKVWKNKSRSESWTPDKRELARQRELAKRGKN